MVEAIEKAALVQKLVKVNGYCFVWGFVPDEDGFGWIQQNLAHKDAVPKLINGINDIVMAVSKGRYRLGIVENPLASAAIKNIEELKKKK